MKVSAGGKIQQRFENISAVVLKLQKNSIVLKLHLVLIHASN